MLNWAKLDPAKVERAIKALLRELFPTAQGINGAGGDGGRDVVMPVDGGVRIFEIKSFTATLNGSQKRQIQESLRAAMRHDDLLEWILIVPHDPTPAELDWFNTILAANAPGVKLRWWDRAWLDGCFASRMALRRYVEGADAELLERAAIFDKETAVLAGGIPDLAHRQARLGELASELSPFWRVTPSLTSDGSTRIEITEKSPGDADRDPIAFNARFLKDVADPEALQVQQTYQQVLDFGGRVAIPGDYLEGLEITTSPETAALFGDWNSNPLTSLEISSMPDLTELCGTLQAVESDGVIRAFTDITFVERHRGNRGITAIARDGSGLLTLRLQATNPEHASEQHSHLHLELAQSAGVQPERSERLLAVLAAAEQGAQLRVRVGPVTICSVAMPSDADRREAIESLAELVSALVTIQEHVGQIVPIPDVVSNRDHRMIQMLAKAIRGDWVRLREDLWTPDVDSDHLGQFVELFGAAGSGVRMEIPDGMFDLDGVTYQLGPIAYMGRGLTLLNGDDLNAQATAGGPLTARLKAEGGIWLLPIPPPDSEQPQTPPAVTVDGPADTADPGS